MGTPASLLDLIARGGPMQVGIDQRKEKAAALSMLANAKQSEAAAQAQTVEAEANRQKIAQQAQDLKDQQAIAAAFQNTDRTPAAMDAFIRQNASGKGIMAWEKHSQDIQKHALEMDEKKRAAALAAGQQAGAILSSVEQGADYAAVYPQLEEILGKGKVPKPEEFTKEKLPQLYATLQYTDNVLKNADAEAKIEQTKAATAKALQDAMLAQRTGFLQAIRPDMSPEEFAAVRTAFPEASKQFPSAPGQWIKAATQEAVKVGDRPEVEQKQRVLAGTSPTGITAEQQAKLDMDSRKSTEDVRHHKALEGAAATAARVAGANSMVQREGMLRDDFAKESKNFVSMRDAYGKIKQAASSDSAASDIALIYGFMRVMDPTSTVREGEFATAQNAGSIPDRVIAAYNRAVNGGRLTPDLRKDFVTQAEKIYKQTEADHAKTERFYGDVAKRYGMEPDKVLPNYRTTFKDGADKPIKDMTEAELMERLNKK